ncbi:MAG: S8 family serine peptidase [Candidatus Eisenbacteria bacterium]
MIQPTTSQQSSRLLLSVLAILVITLTASCGRSLPTAVAPAHDRARPVAGGRGGTDIEGEVVVMLMAGADPSAIAADHQATLLEYESDELSASFLPAVGQTPLDLQTALSSDPRVASAEPNFWLENAETRQQSFAFDDGSGTPEAFAEQPAADALHLGQAHDIADGSGITVAILDSGIDRRHPLLRNAYAGGIDLVDGDDDPSDVRDGLNHDGDAFIDEGFGHGTHVAGIIHLVAPGAKLLAVRVLDSDGRGSLFDIATGVRWAVAHGAKVVNLSLGSLRTSDALSDALSEAEELGVIVIASAGNWGAETPVEFPAKSSHVAAVAAVDAQAAPAGFSSFGNNVALSAPGVGVRSTFPGGGYRLWSGTSMAAPFVAGTCALLAELHPDWNLTQMTDRLGYTASPVLGGDSDFGAGVVDAGAALARERRRPTVGDPVTEEIRPR